MTLIKSISGIRGTIHANDDEGLCSKEIKKCIVQFYQWLLKINNNNQLTIIVGRDGRVSGKQILDLISDQALELNINVINLGLTTTPSVQVAILDKKCAGGVMVSASHNPHDWNGLKLLNYEGEFLSKDDSLDVFNFICDYKLKRSQLFKEPKIQFVNYQEIHLSSILELVDVDIQNIQKSKFKVVIDGINSSGGVYVPALLHKLGADVVELNCIPDGNFAHKPEPIPENLIELCNKVQEVNADIGIAVDPDVDRLVLICEDGSFFGEEYTIVAITKYILSRYPNSSVVSNLSTTSAVRDVAYEMGAKHYESAVGEINVVELMKEKKSIIGGEGSGGVIFSLSHYGRDALVGIALFLSYLANLNKTMTDLKETLPSYHMLKEKILIPKNLKFHFDDFVNHQIQICHQHQLEFVLIDGIKIYYSDRSWSHIRISNTEPLIRLIIESNSSQRNKEIKKSLISVINNYLK